MIALATRDDMKRAIGMADGYAGQKIHEKTFVDWWGQMIERGLATVLYRESNGEMKEVIGILMFDSPFTGEKAATIGFWYVADFEEKSLARGLLFRRAYEFLKNMGCKTISCHPVLNTNFNGFSRFLQRQGFVPVEVQYKKEIT